MDDGEPFGRVLLIPDAVDVNGARWIGNLVALFLQIGNEFYVIVVQFIKRAEDLQAGSQLHGRDFLELDESGVRDFLRHLLAVLDVDVLRLVAAVFDGVALARFWAFASQTGHFRADYIAAEAAEVFEGSARYILKHVVLEKWKKAYKSRWKNGNLYVNCVGKMEAICLTER